MNRTVIAGLDGTAESRAAAEWAAREAELRGLTLRLVRVWEAAPGPVSHTPLHGHETDRQWSERVHGEAAAEIRRWHPGVRIDADLVSGRPADVLTELARDAELLALGSRGLSGLGGYLVGSVGLAVVARAPVPVVLVRAGGRAAETGRGDAAATGTSGAAADATAAAVTPAGGAVSRPVVLGLPGADPAGELVSFAFRAAELRGASLRVVHGWNPPPSYAYALYAGIGQDLSTAQAAELDAQLAPWREKFPTVDVIGEARCGSAGQHLADASRDASLVVVGRRVGRHPVGPRVGPVAHTVLHHAVAPVAVVPHA
ncbi:universal stress protein [Streptomyces sp. NPDC090306]|uniref:universal stress protein n=1 Tax=Streptomyces sp. NPDC090306 TaxID=3365961 RepID=UPI003809CD0E